jgi:hypothetical protein
MDLDTLSKLGEEVMRANGSRKRRTEHHKVPRSFEQALFEPLSGRCFVRNRVPRFGFRLA